MPWCDPTSGPTDHQPCPPHFAIHLDYTGNSQILVHRVQQRVSNFDHLTACNAIWSEDMAESLLVVAIGYQLRCYTIAA